jgi:carboxybiotin decarboxylase
LFFSFFLGIAIRESGITQYIQLIENVFLYGATFFLGLVLGVLCEASTLLNPKILLLLLLGMLALLFSGIGGILGGYVVYYLNHKNFNPVIGIAGVSCVPTTLKSILNMIQIEQGTVTILGQNFIENEIEIKQEMGYLRSFKS